MAILSRISQNSPSISGQAAVAGLYKDYLVSYLTPSGTHHQQMHYFRLLLADLVSYLTFFSKPTFFLVIGVIFAPQLNLVISAFIGVRISLFPAVLCDFLAFFLAGGSQTTDLSITNPGIWTKKTATKGAGT